jgi:hypothetical protein
MDMQKRNVIWIEVESIDLRRLMTRYYVLILKSEKELIGLAERGTAELEIFHDDYYALAFKTDRRTIFVFRYKLPDRNYFAKSNEKEGVSRGALIGNEKLGLNR